MTFLISFLILFYIDQTTYPINIKIKNLTNNHINKNIIVEGKIIKQSNFNSTKFFNIKDETGILKAVSFKSEYELHKSRKYYFMGKITKYNNELELITSKIWK